MSEHQAIANCPTINPMDNCMNSNGNHLIALENNGGHSDVRVERPNVQPGSEQRSYSAREIAILLGVSDSTVRNRWRPQLEEVYGKGTLQDALGNYTPKAFEKFQLLQNAVASQIPKRNNSDEIVYRADGTPAMVPNKHRIGWFKFKALLEEPLKPAIAVSVEVVSDWSEPMAIVSQENDDSLQIMDSVAYQYTQTLAKFHNAGRVMGQKARSSLNKGFAEGFAESTDTVAESILGLTDNEYEEI